MTINYRIKYRIDVGHRSPQLEFTFKILGYHSIRSVVCDSSLFLTPVYVSSTVCMLLLLVHIDRIGFRHDTLVYCKLFPQGYFQFTLDTKHHFEEEQNGCIRTENSETINNKVLICI